MTGALHPHPFLATCLVPGYSAMLKKTRKTSLSMFLYILKE
jgi:hypothetical protein